MNECGVSESSVSTDSTNGNSFLSEFLILALWVFIPITSIAFLLYCFINTTVNFNASNKFILSNSSNVSGYCKFNKKDDIDEKLISIQNFMHMYHV